MVDMKMLLVALADRNFLNLGPQKVKFSVFISIWVITKALKKMIF